MAGEKKPHRFEVGNTWGRPPVFEHAEDLASKIIDYFNDCIEAKERPTISGMALYVGFESRKSFDNQANRSPEFLHIVKRAKLVVEQQYEQLLTTVSVTGAIFALKQMGWSDKVEQTVDVNAKVNQTVQFTDYDKLSDATLEEIASLESDQGTGGAGEA